MPQEETKPIFILLTEHTDAFSRFFRKLTGCRFTHASIGIEGPDRQYFGFLTKKGFRAEYPVRSAKLLNREHTQCVLLQIDVSDSAYVEIAQRLSDFKMRARDFKYNFLGVVCCFLGIPRKPKNSYFCSQFIAELLTDSGVASLGKNPNLYLPDDFQKEPAFHLRYEGLLKDLNQNVAAFA